MDTQQLVGVLRTVHDDVARAHEIEKQMVNGAVRILHAASEHAGAVLRSADLESRLILDRLADGIAQSNRLNEAPAQPLAKDAVTTAIEQMRGRPVTVR